MKTEKEEKTMRVKRIMVKQSDPRYEQCRDLCGKAARLWNVANYHFDKVNKWLAARYPDEKGYKFKLSGYDVRKHVTKHPAFRDIPSNVAGASVLLLHDAWKSFFKANKSYRAKLESGSVYLKPVTDDKGEIRTRRDGSKIFIALDRKSGKNYPIPKPPTYRKQSDYFAPVYFVGVGGCRVKDDRIVFAKKTVDSIKAVVKSPVQTRIIPDGDVFWIELVYKEETKPKPDLSTDRWIGIDLNINNLAAVAGTHTSAYIVSGKPIKSQNRYYNRKTAKLRAKLATDQKNIDPKQRQYRTHRLEQVRIKRNNQVKTGLHRVSKYLIDRCVREGIGSIAIGYNPGWKQESNLGRVNNEKFVQIPHGVLLSQIQYKAKAVGINVVEVNEAYTTLCESMTCEPIEKHDEYRAKSNKTKLFVQGDGRRVNSDINAALNILRVAIGDDFVKSIDQKAVMNPVRITV